MDTREKIITLSEFATVMAQGQWVIIAGLFDPLTATEASRIARLAKDNPEARIMAAVLDNPSSLLPVQARCALVAALRQVHNVVAACPAQLQGALPAQNARLRFVDELSAGGQRSQEFVDLVIARQQGAGQ